MTKNVAILIVAASFVVLLFILALLPNCSNSSHNDLSIAGVVLLAGCH
jgi:hypothetical protein